ncbi:helix-turn-helix domain-containing protein [Streptomyces sp. NPDC046197]|uniref:helix-turn-helix domain-containing protein n=1 Tax=Streptomyces sp. NPDC046197 TaxID=3154337 RepID=UPI0033E697C6
MATRARIVLLHAESRQMKEIAASVGVLRPTMDAWLARFTAGSERGLACARNLADGLSSR